MSRAYKQNYLEIAWHELPPIERPAEIPVQRSQLAAPRIAGDHMEPVQSQLTGRIYDSKSALRREYKQHGMIEVGNDPARLRQRKKPPTDRKKLHDNLQRAAARVKRGERSDPRLADKTWD